MLAPRLTTALLLLAASLPAQAQPAHRHPTHTATARPSPQPHRTTPGCRLDPYGGLSCYDLEGNPYDPDIIGGPNHVGEGGPAANFF